MAERALIPIRHEPAAAEAGPSFVPARLRPFAPWGLLALLALGWLVRLYSLAAQSLWNDEGTSVALARLSLSAILSGAAHDIHPPLYYLLLHFWIGLAGDGEFAVRFLSAASGLALIAATAALARTLFGLRVALLAAGLSALSAFQLYYSQETRMYIWVALWGALSLLALARFTGAAEKGKIDRRALAAFLLTALAALYTHYFAPALLLAEGLAVGVWFLLAWRRGGPMAASRFRYRVAFWLALAGVLIVVAFLPWLVYAGNQLSSWPAISDRFSLPELTWRVLSAFVLGIDTPLSDQAGIVALFGLLLLVGLLPPTFAARRPDGDSARARDWPVLLCASAALVPLLFMYAVSLQRPAYNPKFLLLATPAFLVLVARGLARFLPVTRDRNGGAAQLGRTLAFGVILCVLLVGAWNAVQGVYADPRLQRDDYRGVIGYINSFARANDAVLVDAPGQIDVVRYYYRGAAPLVTLPVGRPLAQGPTDAVLGDLIANHDNIFALYWATEQADPAQYVERALSAQRFQAADEWHGNIRFAQYGNADGAPAEWVTAPAQFGDEITLAGVTRQNAGPLAPGRVLSLQFDWRALKHPSANYKVFVHLLDAGGRVVSQRDVEPVDGFRPTTSWYEGDAIADRMGLLIRPGTPPGPYTVELGLYRPENGQRLPLASGADHLILGAVLIAAP
ncbi:MAG: glycosyltransferase family 39 protein [Anaerolineae bacterium]